MDLSHNEIVTALTDVAAPVMVIALGKMVMPEDQEAFRDEIKQGVIEVLKHYKQDLGSIDALGNWPPIIRDADERARLVFIALVLNIYNR